MEAPGRRGRERHASKRASLLQRQDASGIRLKALQGVGQKNPDADHAKQCGNCLDHNNCPLRPRGHKTAWPAEQSKEFPEPNGFAGRLMISGNRECQEEGKPLARMATLGPKADTILTSTSSTAGNRAAWANFSVRFRRVGLENGGVAKNQMRCWPNRHMVRLVGLQSVRRPEMPGRRR